jgi:hypothetical protein
MTWYTGCCGPLCCVCPTHPKFPPKFVAKTMKEEQSMFRDIDAILARLETGIAAERTAMGALLGKFVPRQNGR